MTAPSGVKAIMDNQFKNVKTHARLLSKAMWYEWRMKLLDGLKEGLVQISNGMDEDAENLAQQEGLLEPMLPKLIEENGRLQGEYENLQAQADELASCDQDELRQARDKLRAVDDDLQAKLSLLAQLGQELQAKDESVQDALERRDEYHAEIKEAERVRQDSRGWKPSEVSALQGTSSPSSRVFSLFPLKQADPCRSKLGHPGRNARLEDHLGHQVHSHLNLQRYSPALLHAFVVSQAWLLLY